VKLGLVGYGAIARAQHEPAIAATDGIELVALADPAARHDGLPVYRTLAAMLDAHPEITAVSLCQPPAARYDAACEAIAAGRHVMLEKPPAATLAEAEALVPLAERAGATLFAAWHSRAAAAVGPATEWLAQATIRSVRIEWKEDVRHWHPGQRWIWQDGGFGVFDPGINALSILTEILPHGVELDEAQLEVPSNCAMPIGATLAMTGPSGYPIEAVFDFRQTGPQTWDIVCETDIGTLCLSAGGNLLEIDGIGQPVGPEREYRLLYRRFAELVARGESDADFEPLRLAEQALVTGSVSTTPPFEE
jgi:D-galactose 1-dehydrogenase